MSYGVSVETISKQAQLFEMFSNGIVGMEAQLCKFILKNHCIN